MVVKWNGDYSSPRALNGGGPQGSTIGILEYLSQSNNNANFLNNDEKYKYIDDLSILEVVNVILAGISSYNFKRHVASDIGEHGNFLSVDNIKAQNYLDKMNKWTNDNEMKLNETKTKYMIFNFSKKYQFNMRIHLNENLVEQVNETKLLGCILTDDLTWHSNTRMLVKQAYKQIVILHKIYAFNLPHF